VDAEIVVEDEEVDREEDLAAEIEENSIKVHPQE
jgi:hypothetical protein